MKTLAHGITIDNIQALGTLIMRFKLPIKIVNEINETYDKWKGSLDPANDYLAGQIKDEKEMVAHMTEEHREIFLTCFNQYLKTIHKQFWDCKLGPVWINDMKTGEYNPSHTHMSPDSELGLTSVLMLKKPDTYGKEISREGEPTNGYLEMNGGDQAILSVSQIRANMQPGELYVFPYQVLHGVYPFFETKQTRRTLSWNCDLHKILKVRKLKPVDELIKTMYSPDEINSHDMTEEDDNA
jgi:hypothetical protein